MSAPDVQLEDRVRAYLAALLRAPEVPEAVGTALASDDPFLAAHRIVHDRVRVTTEVEVDVLVEDAGLSADEAAAIVGVPVEEAHRAVAAASAAAEDVLRAGAASREPIVIVDDSGEPFVLPDDGRRRRRWPWFVAVLVVLIGVSALVLTYGDDPCASATFDVPDAPIAVERACVTHQVDVEGRPVAPRHTFALGEPVTFWFGYDRRVEDDDFLLTLVVTRDGEVLPTQPQFPPPDNCLGPCEQAHVTIPADLVDDIGDYTVAVRWNGETLAAGDFTVVRADV